ncbi:hypothetical protein J2T60_000152 [Natronospira proteinivora]|uniref:Lipid A 3-O-deacylase PagL n=1 Tax=Natronospira proteinivora TaxID=1807133 RepID=A0ABT1G897_9GAMM|nr:hypothetical protein [Natronospira proteinivora]MCP1726187.1 hypothetical protein [Natronospira proteinivora]
MKRLFCLLVFCLGSGPLSAGDWSVGAYWAKNSPDRLIDILRSLDPEMRASYLNALVLNRQWHEGDWLRWEWEAQLVRHHGMQNHWESNAVLVARWMHFPWDQWVDTRFALGQGLSYAVEVPPLEPRSDPEDGESARWLNYLLLELELAPPRPEARWSSFIRVHHRSGVFGTFSGVEGGSNFIGLGLRYRF